jgi:hypothetical protein
LLTPLVVNACDERRGGGEGQLLGHSKFDTTMLNLRVLAAATKTIQAVASFHRDCKIGGAHGCKVCTKLCYGNVSHHQPSH